MADELRDLLAFAHQIAWQAGKITLRYFQSDLAVEHKADASPVTIADREAEAFLRAAISARYPDHAILGEEEGLSGGAGAPTAGSSTRSTAPRPSCVACRSMA